MIFKQIEVGHMSNYAYIFADKEGGEGILIDPGYDPEKLIEIISDLKLNITKIVLTHHHYDHVTAAPRLKVKTGASICAHPEAENMIKGEIIVDCFLNEGDKFKIGDEIEVNIIHTPGHSVGGICLIIDDKYLVTGDTLFIGNCGRADLNGSNPEDLFNSLQRLKSLPEHLIVCPGHNYGPQTTRALKDEKLNNPTLLVKSLNDFMGVP